MDFGQLNVEIGQKMANVISSTDSEACLMCMNAKISSNDIGGTG